MFTRVLAAVDFSDMGRDLLHRAAQLTADVPGAHLQVVHVVPDPLDQPWTVEAIGIDLDALTRASVEDATRRLAKLVAAEAPTGVHQQSILVGRAAEEIVRCAGDTAADVIVMGTHGYGPVKRFMLGSVAERVLRQAQCPVLLIPHRALREATGAGDAPATTGATA